MADGFDPYKKWLGIAPKDQPPHHYRLLGLDPFEDDPDTIENASDRQMTHVRTFAKGPYGELSQRLLNEISAAKLVLLSADQRAAYDAQLKKWLASQWSVAAPVTATGPLPTARPLPAARPVAPAAPQGEQFDFTPSEASSVTSRLSQKKPFWQQPAVVGGLAAGLLIVVGLVVASSHSGDSKGVAKGDGDRVAPQSGVARAVKPRGVTPPKRESGKSESPLPLEPPRQSPPPEIEKPASSGNVNVGECRVMCYTEGRWNDFPLEKMSTSVEDGVLAATNTTGIRQKAMVYFPLRLEGNFKLQGEFRGRVAQLGINSASGEDRCAFIHGGSDDVWHRFRIERTHGKMSMDVDGEPKEIRFYGCDDNIVGFLFVTIESDKQASLRGLGIDVGSGVDASPDELVVKGQPLDLLKLIDVERDAVKGEWRFEEGVLVTPIDEDARLQIPFTPPAEYSLEAVVANRGGRTNFSVGLVGGGKQFNAVLDAWMRNLNGLELLDGKNSRDNETTTQAKVFTNDQPRTILYTVRADGVSVAIDDKTIIDWRGDFARFSLFHKNAVPNKNCLFLLCNLSLCHIHSLTLIPIGKTAAVPDTGDASKPAAVEKLPVSEEAAREAPVPD